jgi:hypothetical protein
MLAPPKDAAARMDKEFAEKKALKLEKQLLPQYSLCIGIYISGRLYEWLSERNQRDATSRNSKSYEWDVTKKIPEEESSEKIRRFHLHGFLVAPHDGVKIWRIAKTLQNPLFRH